MHLIFKFKLKMQVHDQFMHFSLTQRQLIILMVVMELQSINLHQLIKALN